MNKCIFSGNLTAKPLSKTTTKGVNLTTFTMAINDGYGEKKKTFFINCIAFGKTGEVAYKYLDKGNKITICSRVNIDSYTDQEGKKRYSTSFVVDELELPARAGATDPKAKAEEVVGLMGQIVDEEIPF